MRRTPATVECLISLYHLAQTALSANPGVPTRHDRMLWAAKEFAKEHPEYSTPRAYIILDCALA